MGNKKQIRDEVENLKVQIRRKEKRDKAKPDVKWIVQIMVISFAISLVFSFASEMTLPNVHVLVGVLVVILFIILGLLFDMIGVAVTSADEKPFHSMNSRKVKGADIAVKFKKNADKVSSFCNDVIGDICGIISGSIGVNISVSLANQLNISLLGVTLITTAQ